MNLPKILDLISEERLTLAQLGTHIDSDPFECSAAHSYGDPMAADLENRIQDLSSYAPEWYKEHRTSLDHLYRSDDEQQTHDPRVLFMRFLRAKDDEFKRRVLWALQREQLKTEVWCCCWYHGTEDSDAMWRLYANEFGAALTTTVERLKRAISAGSPPNFECAGDELILAPVSYEESKAVTTEPWLVKRGTFRHEKEARLYGRASRRMRREGERLYVPVRLGDLIDKLIVSPYIQPSWKADAIKQALDLLLSKKKIQNRVETSKHLSLPYDLWTTLLHDEEPPV